MVKWAGNIRIRTMVFMVWKLPYRSFLPWVALESLYTIQCRTLLFGDLQTIRMDKWDNSKSTQGCHKFQQWLWVLLMNIHTRTVTTSSQVWILKHELCTYTHLGGQLVTTPYASSSPVCSKLHTRLQSVILSTLNFVVSCSGIANKLNQCMEILQGKATVFYIHLHLK